MSYFNQAQALLVGSKRVSGVYLGGARIWPEGYPFPTDKVAQSRALGIPVGFTGREHVGVQDGVDLVSSGNVRTTADGQVIENRDIKGSLVIAHDNVVVRNCRVTNSLLYHIDNRGSAGTLFEHLEIRGVNDHDAGVGIDGGSYTARYVWFHRVMDGFRVNPGCLIEYCLTEQQSDGYINGANGERLHSDGFQVTYGPNTDAQETIVQHNTFLAVRCSGYRNNVASGDFTYPAGKGNSGGLIGSEAAPVRRYRFRNNYFASGSYSFFQKDSGRAADTNDPRMVQDVQLVNNTFAGDALYGDIILPADGQDGYIQCTGNVRKDGSPATIDRWGAPARPNLMAAMPPGTRWLWGLDPANLIPTAQAADSSVSSVADANAPLHTLLPVGYPAVQADASKRPTYRKTGGPNSRTYLEFTDGWLDVDGVNFSGTPSDAPSTHLVAFRLRSVPASGSAFAVVSVSSSSLATQRRQILVSNASGTPTFTASAGTNVAGPVIEAGNWYVAAVRFSSSFRMNVNGSIILGGNPGTNSLLGLRVGASSANNGSPIDIAGVAVAAAALSNAQMDAAVYRVGKFFGLNFTPPAVSSGLGAAPFGTTSFGGTS